MRRNIIRIGLCASVLAVASVGTAMSLYALTGSSSKTVSKVATVHTEKPASHHAIKKVLFFGDSMTGWMAERLNAYGVKNGFEVATVVWDGSTIAKWGASAKLKSLIEKENPDAVFVCLGINELFEKNPQSRLEKSLSSIRSAVGSRELLWIGPPSWPGHQGGDILNNYLESELGPEHYFRSSDLQLERQSKSNPHPTRAGIVKWMDKVVEWIPENTNLNFESLSVPGASQMSRGKTFIYKRMKETL